MYSWIARLNIVKITTVPQGNLQSQCNPYQITNGIFHRMRTKILNVWKHRRLQIAGTILRKKNTAQELHSLTSGCTELYSYQCCMLPAPKQTCRSMEEDRKTRNKPTHLWSINLRQRRQEYTKEKNTVSTISNTGKTGQLYVKE